MQQDPRALEYTPFMYPGSLLEFAETGESSVKPRVKASEDYISGRIG